MSVWLCIPSARPPEEAERVLKLWRERGYKIALWLDPDKDWRVRLPRCDHFAVVENYPGYACAVNRLIRAVCIDEPDAEWFVTGGDDVEPDMNHTAEEISRQCSEHFYNVVELAYPPSRPTWSEIPAPSSGGSGTDAPSWKRWSTFGVMQPTGDRFAGGAIDRICGSPWMGREFCRRMYQGNGPLFEGYRHMFVDEELQEVTLKLGVLWQRPDLIHLHRHFQREDDTSQSDAVGAPIPAHLVRWNTQQHWAEAQTLFRARKALGFPEHEPIP